MPFFSTRGSDAVTASQAILRGIAPDGGLYVPGEFPQMTLDEIAALQQMSYRERAVSILSRYLDDFTSEEITASVAGAYADGKFDDPAVAPVKKLDDNTFVLELFHGPTMAFKDMALQLLPYLTGLSAKKNGEEREVSILVATSGDTGKAALEGFGDVPGTSCTVFYPLDGVSPVQQLQMTTTAGKNTHVIAVHGNFDDAQTGVKKLFASGEFADAMNSRGKVLSSANSINFGRLVPQVVYYFSAYADLLAAGAITLGDKVSFVVPTGNFGDILAGYYAMQMGLPVAKLICASNRNKVLTDFFATGEYSVQREFYKTDSPSMDILVSSNLERLLYEVSGRDAECVRTWMEELKTQGCYDIGAENLYTLLQTFAAGTADDEETRAEIKRCLTENGYLMDPHTAVASKVLRDYRAENEDDTVTVVLSTANPYKFAMPVLAAVAGDEALQGLDAFAASDVLERTAGVPVPAQVKALPTLPVLHTAQCDKEDMGKAVLAAFDNK
ncbi:MAG: threonine synthase [Clostridia bacterium]|nr:threonine synthase [Clostridia bacterium]